MVVDGFDRANRQDWAQGKCHVRRAQGIQRNGRHRKWQALATERRRCVYRSPAIGDIGFVGRDKTFGHDDFAIFQTRTNGVAYPVEWRKFALRKCANAFHNCLHHIGRGIGEAFMLRQGFDTYDMLQDKCLFSNGCRKGHDQ